MTERERLELRKFREELSAQEDRVRLERQRPLREAEQRFAEAVTKVEKATRDRIFKRKDDEVFIDPETMGIRMTVDEAEIYNGEQAAIFAERNPSYYACPANRNALLDYLHRNGVRIVSSCTFEAAFKRLALYGLLQELPTAEPATETVEPQQAIGAKEPLPPEIYKGWDLHSGLPKTFTKREVDGMTADDYRRHFRIYKAELNDLPSRNW